MAEKQEAGGIAFARNSGGGLEEAIREFIEAMEPRGDAYHLITHFVDTWLPDAEDSAWLEVAASFAARHSAFEGDEYHLRSWLALLASQEETTWQIGGQPRHVLDAAEHLVLAQTRLRGQAIDTIWQMPMLGPKDAAVALGAKETNRERVRQHRGRSWLLGLPRDRGYLYPAFQFDPLRRDVFSEVRAVNELLDAVSDPWGVASWWVSKNARIGAAPSELVGTGRSDDLLALAGAVLEPVG
ncbi:MAG: hypothetical protein F4X68_07565 [Acidimicrobiia bacterium]|nr:hypothetical protein [Acidimicrobiia bacterium]